MTEAAAGVLRCERITFPASDGHGILTDIWQPHSPPRAVVQVLHGLGEHISRYERFAADCNEQGLAVVAHNHRGHGESCAVEELGHFADQGGWDSLISDALQVQDNASRQFPDIPLILLGHSMGSYIAQSLVMRHPDSGIHALVLSATTFPARLEVRAGNLLARLERFRLGPRASSKLLNKLGFGNFNKPFAPNRTEYDWLSRDPQEVDKYVGDPLCGAPSSCQLWVDLTFGLLEISTAAAIGRVPPRQPLLITGGASDPVGGEAGLSKLAQRYRKAGHEEVSLQIYAEGRHEMLNETNRAPFTADVLAWIGETL